MCDYVMDPFGDVILTLSNPNAPFAIWDGSEDGPQTNSILSESATFLVSSRHLILASPMFKAMLTGVWEEGDKNNGTAEVGAEDWDTEALVIVMNVLHSHYRQVPKKVSLEMLAKIAIIVDYYQIHEALQIIASLWINALKKSLPDSPGRDVTLWILVSWDITIPHDLPIPLAVVDQLNQHRKGSINVIAAAFRGLRDDYIHGRPGCSFECRAMHLGTLMKNLSGLKFLSYPPKTPNEDLSLAEVVECITTMRSPKWYSDDDISYSKRRSHTAHQCHQRPQQVGAEGFELGIGRKQLGDVHIGTLNEFASLLVHGIQEKMERLRLDNFI
ncbi:hypothetical protein QBC40DRAFT_342952 [Triangularia verruculosa]|uniref:BTB domain-containing protein n=1 Tax=Triangularia verruculosa TaxID=2587418 RepID=A0AAN6X903_9PEZI|nr:hypothetical protein QBC40DRAFT_342952 [Triangularia verruculosa]